LARSTEGVRYSRHVARDPGLAAAAAARLLNAQQRAELAHRRAAGTHDRAAAFFESLGKSDRAEAERTKAQRDREGAEIERARQGRVTR
jgi:hypothetical protein